MAQTPFPYQPFALGHIVAATQNITSIANASNTPVVLTVTGHGYPVAQTIYIRVATVTGQTAINADWQAFVTDANTLTITGGRGWNVASIAGNGVASASGTVARTPLPITVNHPEFAGLGIQVQALTFQVFTGNSGNIYIGAIIPPAAGSLGAFFQKATPFADCMYILKNTLVAPQNIPIFSPGNSNIIAIDTIYVDFDTIGDGVLVTAFQR